MDVQNKQGCLRVGFKWTARIFIVILLLAAALLGFLFRTALYDRFYLFPKQAEAWEQLQAARVAPTLDDGWNEYRGALHSHSELSHDSAIPFPGIAKALHAADVDFICMTDHYNEGKADYSLGWNGIHEDILFIRGYELEHGLMPWGVPEGTVILASEDPRAVATKVHEMGAVMFYSHTEKERIWDLPELEGMEIYNTHTDFLDEDSTSLRILAPQILLCLGAYPEQTLRLIFDPPAGQLARWDELNKTRHITGIAANDAHQNVGVRGFYTAEDTLVVKGTGEKHENIKEIKLNAFTRALLRLSCGPLEPGREVFRFELDPYALSSHFVNTHLLARDLTEPEVLDSLRAGRAFVSFDMLSDATGFVCFAEGAAAKAVMGESITLEPGLRLRATAPNQCRFLLLKDGQPAGQAEGAECAFDITEAGTYRVEAQLNILGEWVPWIYANPIGVTLAAVTAGT